MYAFLTHTYVESWILFNGVQVSENEMTCMLYIGLLEMRNFYCATLHAERGICYANSVCLSVTRVLCIKMAERIIEILSPSDRPIILVFGHQGSLSKSEGIIPNRGAKYKGVAIFDQYAAISRKR